MPDWMWVVKFKDGAVLRQTEGSLFQRDVVPRGREVQAIYLESEKAKIGLNLETGDFLTMVSGEGMFLSAFNVGLGPHADLEFDMPELIAQDQLKNVRPIFFRRVTRKLVMGSGGMLEDKEQPRYVYAIGWQADVVVPELDRSKTRWHPAERNVKHIVYVHPDGRIVLT